MANQQDVSNAIDSLNTKVSSGLSNLNSSIQAEFTAVIAEIVKLQGQSNPDLQPLVDQVNQAGVNVDTAFSAAKAALDKETSDLNSGALDTPPTP